MTLICVKFDADLINISKLTSRKTKWPRFFWPTRYCLRHSQKVDLDLKNWSVCPPFMLLFIENVIVISGYWLLFLFFLVKLVKYLFYFVWLIFVLPFLVK